MFYFDVLCYDLDLINDLLYFIMISLCF